MSKARYFYTVDEDQFEYYAKEHYPEGASFDFLFGIQPHKVEKFVLEGTESLSAKELMNIINTLDFDADFDWWGEFRNPDVGLFSAKVVKQTIEYFDHEEWYNEIAPKIEKENHAYVLESLEKLEKLFKSAGEKDLAIMSYYE